MTFELNDHILSFPTLEIFLDRALALRAALMDGTHTGALRLFNGFYEGCPELAADLYARTLVLYDYGQDAQVGVKRLAFAGQFLQERLPFVDCVIHKVRAAPGPQQRCGIVQHGKPAQEVVEHGVRYAVDLTMNQDASLYLDTRALREWLLKNSAGWQMLNAFAYTGSLGAAALVGGAKQVIQVDRNPKFLALARRTADLNQFGPQTMILRAVDFFSQVSHEKRSGVLFDGVILDPPVFSTTEKGTLNLAQDTVRLINKVRPLVKDGGRIVSINNALFLSGAEYMAALQTLCDGGYVEIETLIPVPSDFTGFSETIVAHPPVDPAPFNHPTKIAILRVRRKNAVV